VDVVVLGDRGVWEDDASLDDGHTSILLSAAQGRHKTAGLAKTASNIPIIIDCHHITPF
jgi:hypothetical protein